MINVADEKDSLLESIKRFEDVIKAARSVSEELEEQRRTPEETSTV